MGRPASWKVWQKRSSTAVYVGTYADPAGMSACVFADPRSGRAIGPLNLRLGERTGWTLPAPRVGAPPDAPPGRVGHLEYYGIEWTGRDKGPAQEPRGVFLRFEESAESRGLTTLAVDALLLGLLGDPRQLEALVDPAEVERAHWGLLLARHEEEARRLLTRAKTLLAAAAHRGLLSLTELLFRRLAPPISREALAGFELAEPGVLRRAPSPKLEGCIEPDAGPFAEGPGDVLRFLHAAGTEAWREGLRALPQARESGEVTALGLDAAGRLAVAEDGRISRFRWCSPASAAGLRFGDVLRLQLQTDRIGWAEAVGRNEAARAVEFLREKGEQAWLAAAAAWDHWQGPADAKGIREAVGAHPSVEHARRLEARLPGEGTPHERLCALLALVATYWRAGAFEDAWILLGRMPSILPETEDAPVHRAARMLHEMLESGHLHEATEEARNELGYVWDGTLAFLVEELGPALAGRCAEVFESAGL